MTGSFFCLAMLRTQEGCSYASKPRLPCCTTDEVNSHETLSLHPYNTDHSKCDMNKLNRRHSQAVYLPSIITPASRDKNNTSNTHDTTFLLWVESLQSLLNSPSPTYRGLTASLSTRGVSFHSTFRTIEIDIDVSGNFSGFLPIPTIQQMRGTHS